MPLRKFDPQAVAALRKSFSGPVLTPDDAGYEEARHVHNGLVDKRPALIARCRGTADVVDAIDAARKLELEVAVRGGGHNVAGRATIDDGLLLDLSLMKGVTVDSDKRTVRAQGGVTWGEFNRETQLHGLATTGGAVSTTGVAGLTLGGGVGWLMGKHGLAADNLLSVELVTSDARVLTVDGTRHADLFWALRGGGGNFGVAASFKFGLHKIGPKVTGGMVIHPFEAARDVLRFYREATAGLPDELTIFAALIHAPDGSGTKLAALVLCHCGSLDEGAADTGGIKEFGSPLMDTVGPMEYCSMNTLLDAAYPKGALNYWKSSFLSQLTDEAIDRMIEQFAVCPSRMDALMIEHFHGAATRVDVGATAFPHRREGYNFSVLSEWMDPDLTGRCRDWARDTYATMRPFMAAGRYVNYLDGDEAGDPVAAAYGPNYQRLREIKSNYDPGNFFHMNQNIRP